MIAEFINLTPHSLNVQKEDGSLLTVPPSGTVARVKAETEVVGKIEAVAITRQKFADEIDGVPAQKEGRYYIVSRLAAQALKEAGRAEDILVPGPAIRNGEGQSVGCDGLTRL